MEPDAIIWAGSTKSNHYQDIPSGQWTRVSWPAMVANSSQWSLDQHGEKFNVPDDDTQRGLWLCAASVAWEDVIAGTDTTLPDHRRKIRLVQFAKGIAFAGCNVVSEDERHFVSSCVRDENGQDKRMVMTTYLQAGFDATVPGHRFWAEVWQNSGEVARIVQHGGEPGPDGAGILKIAAPLFMAAQYAYRY